VGEGPLSTIDPSQLGQVLSSFTMFVCDSCHIKVSFKGLIQFYRQPLGFLFIKEYPST